MPEFLAETYASRDAPGAAARRAAKARRPQDRSATTGTDGEFTLTLEQLHVTTVEPGNTAQQPANPRSTPPWQTSSTTRPAMRSQAPPATGGHPGQEKTRVPTP